jgi:HEAT repeat protein
VSKFHPVPEQTIPRLTPLLQDPDASVRRQTAIGLARFGTRATNALPALRQACSDPDLKAKRAAADALAEITGQTVTSRSSAEPGQNSEE